MTTSTVAAEFQSLRDTWQNDPLAFCAWAGWPTWGQAIAEHGLDCQDKQADILRALAGYGRSRVWVRSGNAVGKSRVAAMAAGWFLMAFAPCVVITTAPGGRQVSIIWKRLRELWGLMPIQMGGHMLQHGWTGPLPDWYALGFTSAPNDPNRFQGFNAENILVVIDEANGVGEWVWEGIRGMTMTPNAKTLSIGNPHIPAGGFYEAFAAEADPKRKSRGTCIHIDSRETPNILAGKSVIPGLATDEGIQEIIDDYGIGSPLVQARVYGEFPLDSPDQLIPMAWIRAAVERTLERSGNREIGIDVSRSGEDETVLADRQGPVIGALRYYKPGKEPLRGYEVANYAMAFANEVGATRFKVDVIGLGAGPVDTLQERGCTVFEINVSEAASDPARFPNKRCEEWWKLRKRFELGEVDLPDDAILTAQLAGVRWKPDGRGRIVIEKKEDAKKRGLKSPDRAEAVLMAFADVDDDTIDFGALMGGMR